MVGNRSNIVTKRRLQLHRKRGRANRVMDNNRCHCCVIELVIPGLLCACTFLFPLLTCLLFLGNHGNCWKQLKNDYEMSWSFVFSCGACCLENALVQNKEKEQIYTREGKRLAFSLTWPCPRFTLSAMIPPFECLFQDADSILYLVQKSIHCPGFTVADDKRGWFYLLLETFVLTQPGFHFSRDHHTLSLRAASKKRPKHQGNPFYITVCEGKSCYAVDLPNLWYDVTGGQELCSLSFAVKLSVCPLNMNEHFCPFHKQNFHTGRQKVSWQNQLVKHWPFLEQQFAQQKDP